MAILHPKDSNSNKILTTLPNRRSRPLEDTLNPILKNIFKKYRNVPFGVLSKLYIYTERDTVRFFRKYPEYLNIKEFELIYEKLLAHQDEIVHSTYEPFVRLRYPITQQLRPSSIVTGFEGNV
jgi:hypothetical protein